MSVVLSCRDDGCSEESFAALQQCHMFMNIDGLN